jgi:hypothetical protein
MLITYVQLTDTHIRRHDTSVDTGVASCGEVKTFRCTICGSQFGCGFVEEVAVFYTSDSILYAVHDSFHGICVSRDLRRR